MSGLRRLARRLGAASLVALGIGTSALAQDTPERPNIVFILSDDEDLGIHSRMPKVKALIEAESTTFDDFFVTYPLLPVARLDPPRAISAQHADPRKPPACGRRTTTTTGEANPCDG
jgi:hypothetical protein